LGRAKKKRKLKLYKKRIKKSKQGKNVAFTLSNCPKKLKGISYRYEHKINVHHCTFTDATFNNVKYRGGHITNSSFNKAKLNNMEFTALNMKKNRFRETKFNNCVFFGCNLEGADFKNAIFKNTYFINCKLKDVKNFLVTEEIHIVTHYPELSLSEPLEEILKTMSLNPKFEKYHILTINRRKINQWMLSVLLSTFSESELLKFFGKLLISNKSQFYTIFDYEIALHKYYKK